MILNGFTGRTVQRVERENATLKVLFDDGGYLFVRSKGPAETALKITCMCTNCKPFQCEDCRGIEMAASE